MYKTTVSLRKKRDKVSYSLFNLTKKEMIIWGIFLLISTVPVLFAYFFNKDVLTVIVIYFLLFNILTILLMQKVEREKLWHKFFFGFLFFFSSKQKHNYKNITKLQFFIISSEKYKGD